MSKKLLIIFGSVFSVGIFVFAFVFWRTVNTPVPPLGSSTGETSTSPFPPFDTGTTGSPPFGTGAEPEPDKTIPLTTLDGGTIRAKDFLRDPRTVQDPVNAGRYQLGFNFLEGDTGYPPYVIEYIEATDHFNVVLLQEPLAFSRSEAEVYLKEHLGISEREMCGLRYIVSTPADINYFYSGRSLGFSFCPGSVPISG